MALKAFDASGSGLTSDAVSAILYANANGASVISNSWSGPNFDQPLKDAIDVSPAVVVCAAGNNNLQNLQPNNDVVPQYPASFISSNIISVAATDQNDNLATFSHYGPVSVDLAAPGTNILSTLNTAGAYGYMSGTSMATPHVSGVAALVKDLNQNLTAVQIKNIILSNVDSKDSLSGLVSTGGRLDAYRAVIATPSAPPVADFTGSRTSGAAPLTVVFTDLSTNVPTAWNWTFGDGNSTNSTVQNPVHIYRTAGNFTVSLNASNSGGFNTTTRSGYINITNITASKIGIYQNGWWYLDVDGSYVLSAGDRSFAWGNPGDIAVLGDWNGDGRQKAGIFRNGTWVVDYDGSGTWSAGIDKVGYYGGAGTTPIVGDWNNDLKDEIGVYQNGWWYLDVDGSYVLSAGDRSFAWGNPGDIVVLGDWNGDGKQKAGIFRNGTWVVDYDGSGTWSAGIDKVGYYGGAGTTPIVGDWNNDLKDEIGVYQNGWWYLDVDGSYVLSAGDRSFAWGNPGDIAVLGDWNGDGRQKAGIFRNGTWVVDYDGSGTWSAGIDKVGYYGGAGTTPIVGKWS